MIKKEKKYLRDKLNEAGDDRVLIFSIHEAIRKMKEVNQKNLV